MTTKIDLRRKGDGEYPEDIAKLISLYGGVVGDAERAAGLSLGDFSKVRTNRKPYTDHKKEKVAQAIANFKPGVLPKMSTPPKPLIPETCPPLIADLIRKHGSKKSVIKLLGTSDGSFYAVLSGAQQMPPAWLVKAKADLGLPLIPNSESGPEQQAQQASDAPPVPPFVPWEGQRGTASVKGAPGQKLQAIKNVPIPVVKLLEKHGGNVAAAARSIGYTSTPLRQIVLSEKDFSDKWQRKVHDALHGAAPAFSAENEIPDKYTLGMAIVMAKATGFDRIQDIAELVSGRLVFKLNTNTGWLLIYKMGAEDLPRFKRIAIRDAIRISCP